MRKLRFNSGAEAVHRSATVAEDNGADMTSGSTQLRWSVRKDDNGFYLEIPEGDTNMLTPDEIEQLED